MKTIRFIVENDKIRWDPNYYQLSLVEGSNVNARFIFSKEWDGYTKVVGFRRGNMELEPKALSYGFSCDIPKEALMGTFFRLYVLGKKDGHVRSTNSILVNVTKSKVTDK